MHFNQALQQQKQSLWSQIAAAAALQIDWASCGRSWVAFFNRHFTLDRVRRFNAAKILSTRFLILDVPCDVVVIYEDVDGGLLSAMSMEVREAPRDHQQRGEVITKSVDMRSRSRLGHELSLEPPGHLLQRGTTTAQSHRDKYCNCSRISIQTAQKPHALLRLSSCPAPSPTSISRRTPEPPKGGPSPNNIIVPRPFLSIPAGPGRGIPQS
jgi:hypothetical protein